jgi:hypothetical protein
MEYGLFNFTEKYYRAIDAINWSTLKELKESPRHYFKAINEPQRRKDVFDYGNAFHAKVLEPKKFDSEVAVKPKFTGTGSRKMLTQWKLDHEEKVWISESDHWDIKKMSEMTLSQPLVRDILNSPDTKIEQTVLFKDPWYGMDCKCKIDILWLNPERVILWDLKSTTKANPYSFSHSMGDYGYFGQAAFYKTAVEVALGRDVERVEFIATEKADPYCTGIYAVDPEDLEFGLKVIKNYLGQVKDLRETGEYVGYTPQTLKVPQYQKDAWLSNGI